MADVKEIKILNFGQNAFSVEEMSTEIQALVRLFNLANQREADLVEKLGDELSIIRAAREGIYREINAQFAREQQAAADAAAKAAETKAPAANEADADTPAAE